MGDNMVSMYMIQNAVIFKGKITHKDVGVSFQLYFSIKLITYAQSLCMLQQKDIFANFAKDKKAHTKKQPIFGHTP